MLKKPVTWIVILLVAMLGYVYAPSLDQPQARRSMGNAAMVELAEVKKVLLTDEISALGNAQAKESITLTAQNTDRIDKVHFEDGDVVSKDQLLVSLDHAEEQAQVAELQVNLAEQRRQLQRLLDLQKKSAPSESAIDSQKSLMETTEAKIAIARIRLSEKFIKAPYAGKLGLRQVSPGQLVTNSTVITTLDDLSQIKVEFQLPEKFLNRIAVGQKVTATNVAYDEPFIGSIASIGSRVDEVTRSFKIRALFDNSAQKLRAGMLLNIDVETAASDALVIPESSVIPMNNEHYVYVALDGKVKKIQIEIGRRKPGQVEVIKGLSQGQQVVSKGVLKLRDGSGYRTSTSSSTSSSKG